MDWSVKNDHGATLVHGVFKPLSDGFEPGYRDDSIRPDPRRPYRACNFCGSMHPEDVYNALKAGAKLEMADWKGVGPRKFYISQIPHDREGDQISTVSKYEDGEHVSGAYVDGAFVAGATHAAGKGHGKFYTRHLSDIQSAEAFEALAALLHELHPHVEWLKDEDGRVMWRGRRAPGVR